MKSHFFILCLLILAACITPQKSFEKKQYKQAFRLALSKMQKGKEVEIIETSGDERALPHPYQHIFGIQDDVEDDDDMEEELVELIYRDMVQAYF